jgi:hypothetical protein
MSNPFKWSHLSRVFRTSFLVMLVAFDTCNQLSPTKFARRVTNVDTIDSHTDQPTNASEKARRSR